MRYTEENIIGVNFVTNQGKNGYTIVRPHLSNSEFSLKSLDDGSLLDWRYNMGYFYEMLRKNVWIIQQKKILYEIY